MEKPKAAFSGAWKEGILEDSSVWRDGMLGNGEEPEELEAALSHVLVLYII